MRLGVLAKELSNMGGEEDKHIDFGAAGLYLPAAQTVFATTLTAIVSVLVNWSLPVGAISAIRTLALTAAAGVIVIRRPVRIGQTRGVTMIFSALRPCCLLYVSCLVLEQLVHTCVSDEAHYEHGFYRRIIYHTCMLIMTAAAFLRARSPRGETDMPFLIASSALLVVALLPPPALALSGPLCAPPTLIAAGERVLRAFLFACVYTVHVYSSAPISNTLADTLVCIARSATASAWILGVIVYALPLGVLQVVVVLYCSFSTQAIQYEGLRTPANDLEMDATYHSNMNTTLSNGSMTSDYKGRLSPSPSAAGQTEEEDIVEKAAAFTRSTPSAKVACFQAASASGLTFNLAAAQPQQSFSMAADQQKVRMAEIAAAIP